MPALRATCSLLLFGASLTVVPPTAQRLDEVRNWFARPARLPFAWQALDAASRTGDGREAFARGQQLLDLVPTWTLGHAGFAFRYALTEDAPGTPAQKAERARERLYVALGWIEGARAAAGRREPELLTAAAFLPKLACREFPGLEALLPDGGAAKITDAYYAEAERLFPGPEVREQRIFHAPTLAAALLDAGQRKAAVELLRAAAERADEVRDRALADEWRARIVESRRRLSGEPVDMTQVFADPRFEPLWPHLR